MGMSFVFLLTLVRLLGSGDLQDYRPIDMAAALPAEHIAYLRIDTPALHKDIAPVFAAMQQFPVIQMSDQALKEALQSIQLSEESVHNVLKNIAAIHLSVTAVHERGPRWMVGLEGPFEESMDECLDTLEKNFQEQGAISETISFGDIDMRVLSFKRREGVVYARRKNLLLIASSIPQLKNVLRGVHALEKNSPRQTSVRSHLADHGLSFPTPDQLKATATPLSVYINSQLINLLATYEEGRERLIDDTTLVDFLFDTEAFGPGLITVSDKGIDASLAMNKESHLLSDIQAHEALGQFASLQTNAHFISSVVRLKDSGAAVNRYLTSMRQLLRIVREDEFDDFYNFFQTQFGLSVDEVVQELDEAAVVVRTPTDPSDLRNPEQFMQNNFAVLFSFKSQEKVSEISKTVIEKIKTMDDNVVVEEDGGVTFLSIPREEVTFAISGNVLAFGVKRETCQAVLAAIAAPPATTEKPASMNVNLDVTQIVALSGGPTLLVDDWIFTAELRPDQNGLHLHLNQSIGQVIKTLSSNVPQILAGVQEAQKRARWTQSMNNMRQLVNACVMHQAESSDSSWPKTVDEAVKEWGEYGNRIKRCPVSGQAYTYLQPVITQTSKTMVLYSAARPDGTRITAYADGHTEILSTEEFEAILKKTNELREKELNEIGKDNSADDF